MVRRVRVSSSLRMLCILPCLALTPTFAQAQSPDAATQHSLGGSGFVVAPALTFTAAPTSAAIGDLKGDGRADLVLTTKGSSSVTVLLGDGKGGFEPAVEYAAGKEPGNVLLADLAGRGKLDAVVTDAATGAIEVLMGRGDGSFEPAVSYAAVQEPVALVAGKFGSNGATDLAVASANGIAVLLNDGSGQFTPGGTIALKNQLTSLAASDLRGQGHDDLVVARSNGTLTVFHSEDGAAFAASSPIRVASGPLSSVTAGDFNNDGHPDLAVTEANSGKAAILLGRGDGSFEPAAEYAVGNGPFSAIIADLNHDGIPDLVTVNRSANTFSVLLGKGDGTLKASVDFTAGNAPVAIAAGDLFGKGRSDLAILNSGDASVSLARNKGDGTFEAAPAYRADLEQKGIATGDLNGDGLPDLVVTNFCGEDLACKSTGTATVFLAKKDGTYSKAGSFSLGNGPVAVALADLRGTKKLDLVAANRNDKTLTILPGLGNGKFGEPQNYSLASSPRALVVGDFNGDGKSDIAIASDCGRSACSEPGSVDIWLNRGDGAMKLAASYTVGYGPISIAAADLRNAGHLDLIVANSCGDDSSCKGNGSASILAGNGKGQFTATGEIELGRAPSAIAVANLSGEGLDLLVAERGSDQIAVMHANGKGGFGEAAQYKVGSEPSSLAIGDFDGDGRLDVAVANFKGSTVSVLAGNAKGTLDSAVTYPVGTGPESLVSVSKSRSGPSSLVTANGNGGSSPMGTDITVLLRVHPDVATTPAVAVSFGTTPATVDVAEVLTATVTGAVNAAPTGTVAFTSATTSNIVCQEAGGTPPLNQGSFVPDNTTGVSTATCTTVSLQVPAANPDTITAGYTSDETATYNSNTGTNTLTINQAPTQVNLTPASATVDQAVTFTATITPLVTPAPSPASNIVPFSTAAAVFVKFLDGATAITGCTKQPVTFDSGTGSLTATCSPTAPNLPVGNITAVYNGDTNYAGSTSTNTVSVGQANTSIVLSPTTATVDQAVTFQATIKPSPAVTPATNIVPFATGAGVNVQFLDGGTPITGCTSQPVTFNSGAGTLTATCAPTNPNLPAGNVTAVYTGDSNYNGSTTNTPAVVSVSQTSTTITPASATVDQTVTFTATVKPSPAVTPATNIIPFSTTGINVEFLDGTNPITGCTSQPVTFNSGAGTLTATCAPTAANLPAGNVTAVYPGDSNYNTSTSSPVTVGLANTTATLQSSLNPSTVNQSVTFTATVAPASGSPAQPIGGNVKFLDGTATIGCDSQKVNLVAGSYQAVCTVSNLNAAASPHLINATYLGDNTNYNPSPESNVVTQVVDEANTTTTVTPPAAASTVDQQVTLTATVAPASGSTVVAITGNVVFYDNGSNISGCTSQGLSLVSGSYQATCQTSAFHQGNHPITAIYLGDHANYIGSPISGTVTQVVNAASTSTTLTATPSPSTVDTAVTITAKITPLPSGTAATVAIAGTVAFSADGAPITGCGTQPVALSSGSYSATCITSSLTSTVGPPATTHSLTTVYTPATSPTTDYIASNGSTTLAVSTAATVTTLASSLNPAPSNTNINFTATVSYSADGVHASTVPANGAPIAGTVSMSDAFTNPATAICTNQAVSFSSATGVATVVCSSNMLQADPNPHPITAFFTPSTSPANYSASTSAALDQDVGKNFATTQVTAAPGNSTALNQAVTFTDTLTPPSGGFAPTGTVAFTVDGSTINGTTTNGANCGSATVTLNSKTGIYTANCTTQALTAAPSAAPHSIVATYSGNSNYGGGSSSLTGGQTVATGASTVALSSSTGGTSVVNQPVTFTATVSWTVSGVATPVPAGGVAISGSVAFSDGGTPIPGCGSVNVSFSAGAGTATCTPAQLIAATHSITAAFTTTSSYNSSSTTALFTQTVNPGPTTLALFSSGTPSTINTSVTFTANVTFAEPFPSGGVPLAGTVDFTADGNTITSGSSTNCNTQSLTLVELATFKATCTTSTLTLGQHTIKATYTSPTPSQFATSSDSIPQDVVHSATATAVTPQPATSTVNQQVAFTATVTTQNQVGAFSGMMSFQIGGAPLAGTGQYVKNGSTITTPTCTNVPVSTGGVAECITSALGAGSDTVEALYANDPNYSGSSGNTTLKIQPEATNISVTPVPSTVVVMNPAGHDQSLTLTATVTPVTGTIATSTIKFDGTVSFTANGSVLPGCSAVPIDSTTGTASCPVAFLTQNNVNTILATYQGDNNYVNASNTTTVDVEDYSLVVAAPQKISVTQGYETSTDPFAKTVITLEPGTIQGFAGTVDLTCSVVSESAAPGAIAPKCILTSSSVQIASQGAQSNIPITIDATNATGGAYSFDVSGTDQVTKLVRSSKSFSVTVRAVAGPLTVESGQVTNNSANVVFALPANVGLSSIQCAAVAGPNLAGIVTPATLDMTCSFSPATVAALATAQNATVSVTIGTGGTATSAATPYELSGRSGVTLAGLLGVPLLAFLGLLRGRKSIGSSAFRLMALAVIAFAGMMAVGCGGSFKAIQPAHSGLTPPGTYDVQINGTGTDGNTYQAVLKVNVTL